MYIWLFWSFVCLWGAEPVGNYSNSGQFQDKIESLASFHSVGKCYKLKTLIGFNFFDLKSYFSSNNTVKLCIKESVRPCSNAEQNPWTSQMEANDLLKMIEYFHNYKVGDYFSRVTRNASETIASLVIFRYSSMWGRLAWIISFVTYLSVVSLRSRESSSGETKQIGV